MHGAPRKDDNPAPILLDTLSEGHLCIVDGDKELDTLISCNDLGMNLAAQYLKDVKTFSHRYIVQMLLCL